MIHILNFLLKAICLIVLFVSNLLHLIVALILWDYKYIVSSKETILSIFPPKKYVKPSKDMTMKLMFSNIWDSFIGKNDMIRYKEIDTNGIK